MTRKSTEKQKNAWSYSSHLHSNVTYEWKIIFIYILFLLVQSVIHTESTQSFSDDRMEVNSRTSSISVLSDEGKSQKG